jgi:hypothetical protein
VGDVTLKQTVTALASDTITGAMTPALAEKDFQVDPQDVYSRSDLNETVRIRYSLAAGATDVAASLGTISAGKVLMLKPKSDLKLKVVNAAGTSQLLTFKAGAFSILHVEFTGLLLSNAGPDPIKGTIFIAGD